MPSASLTTPVLLLVSLVDVASSFRASFPTRACQPARVERRGITMFQQEPSDRMRQWSGSDSDESTLEGLEVPTSPAQTLFRHRFLVAPDFCIRMPLDAQSLLYSCTMHDDLSGYMELQLEAFRPLAKVQWCPDAQRMLSLPNAGGSSLISEALAFELLARTFGASLSKTELELRYRAGSKMTDFAIDVFGGYALGVSVTRAYKWHGPRGRKILTGGAAPPQLARSWQAQAGIGFAAPRSEPAGLEPQEARRLLIKKLTAIKESSRNVQNHSWRKQLLLVFTFSHSDVRLLEHEYQGLPAAMRSNTVLLVVRTNGVQWIW